jgi:hypothetical protein
MAANVCPWADPNGSHVLLPKVSGHRRRKRSRLVPFLGDLGQKLFIRKDPSWQNLMGKKLNIPATWASLFALCSISTELVDKIGAPFGRAAVGCVWGLFALYT